MTARILTPDEVRAALAEGRECRRTFEARSQRAACAPDRPTREAPMETTKEATDARETRLVATMTEITLKLATLEVEDRGRVLASVVAFYGLGDDVADRLAAVRIR